MASIGFRLKSKENRQVSIYIYFRPANSKVVSARTGLTINPTDWSSSKKKAKTITLNQLKKWKVKFHKIYFGKPCHFGIGAGRPERIRPE